MLKDSLVFGDSTSYVLMLLAIYHVTAMNILGNCYRSHGNYDEAVSWHEKARKLLQQQDQTPQQDVNVSTS